MPIWAALLDLLKILGSSHGADPETVPFPAAQPKVEAAKVGAYLAEDAHISAAVQTQVVTVGGTGAGAAGLVHVGDASRAAVAQVAEVPRVLPCHLCVRLLITHRRSLRVPRWHALGQQCGVCTACGYDPCHAQPAAWACHL